MKLDSDIKRIVINENIVTELETINKILVNESDRCKFYTLENETIGKYGLTRNSLIERVLALFLFAQPKQELKTANRIHYESEKDAEANKESDWISVNDRMPEEIKFKAEDYLVFNDQGEIEVCFINNRVFRDKREDRNVIASHWRHLPEPPKNN
jgi:hypothetical protein